MNKLDAYRGLTTTNLFVAPLLGIIRKKVDNVGFIDAYIKDEVNAVEYERGVYMLFKPKDMEQFAEFLEEERERKAIIIEEYDYPNGYVMVVYQYPEKWQKDVDLLMKGKYSKTSKEYQNSISKTVKQSKMGRTIEVIAFQHQIFKCVPEVIEYWRDLYGLEIDYKTEECWEFYPEREVFTQETLQNLK